MTPNGFTVADLRETAHVLQAESIQFDYIALPLARQRIKKRRGYMRKLRQQRKRESIIYRPQWYHYEVRWEQ